ADHGKNLVLEKAEVSRKRVRKTLHPAIELVGIEQRSEVDAGLLQEGRGKPLPRRTQIAGRLKYAPPDIFPKHTLQALARFFERLLGCVSGQDVPHAAKANLSI